MFKVGFSSARRRSRSSSPPMRVTFTKVFAYFRKAFVSSLRAAILLTLMAAVLCEFHPIIHRGISPSFNQFRHTHFSPSIDGCVAITPTSRIMWGSRLRFPRFGEFRLRFFTVCQMARCFSDTEHTHNCTANPFTSGGGFRLFSRRTPFTF